MSQAGRAEEESLYSILGVTEYATQDDIKRQYRKMALKYHPDKNLDDPTAADKFKRINFAHSTLKNPTRRAMYDKYGKRGVDFSQQFGDETAESLLKMDNWCCRFLIVFCGIITGCYCCCCCCCCCGKCNDKENADYEHFDDNDGGTETDAITSQPKAAYHSCADDGTVPVSWSGIPDNDREGLLRGSNGGPIDD